MAKDQKTITNLGKLTVMTNLNADNKLGIHILSDTEKDFSNMNAYQYFKSLAVKEHFTKEEEQIQFEKVLRERATSSSNAHLAGSYADRPEEIWFARHYYDLALNKALYVYNLNRRISLDDIVIEAINYLHQRMNSFDPTKGQFTTHVFPFFVSNLQEKINTEYKDEVRTIPLEDVHFEGDTYDDLCSIDMHQLIRQTLPEKDYTYFMCMVAGDSISEIARKHHISRYKIDSSIKKSIKLLREEFRDKGVLRDSEVTKMNAS